MGKYKVKYLPLIIGAALAGGIWLGGLLDFDSMPGRISSNLKKQKLNRLIDYIDYHYVEEVNTDSIVDVTVNGIMKNLDPHSVYIPPEELERITDDMRGNFVGIGVSFYHENDTVSVIKSIEGGPSRLAGIKAGDKILYADDKPLFGNQINNDSIGEILKGEKGSTVTLRIQRAGSDALQSYTITRGNVPLTSVVASYLVTDEIGYIKINRFAESTYEEFDIALDVLLASGMKSLILDLRDNPGGYLDAAQRIADEFLEDERLIVFTKDKQGRVDESFATDDGDFEKGNLYILLNENSASASEVVAGAVQDNDRGWIVGRRSFGKGLVQREMGLGDGSAVRLTISRYYTPTGRSIQKPYTKGEDDSYYKEYENRYNNGELEDASNIEVNDSLKFTTPGGRTVYGGGGIIPDIFVGRDMGYENQTINFIKQSDFDDRFVFEYQEKDRGRFSEMDFETFNNSFEPDDAMVIEFQEYCKRNGLEIIFAAYKDEIKTILKAAIAEQLFSKNHAVEILNREDNMIQRIIEEEQPRETITQEN